MKWCCEIFEGLAASQGQRGLSVVVVSSDSGSAFMLQSRAIDSEATLTDVISVPITVAEEQAIFFCPGCGVELARHYADEIPSLTRNDLRLNPSFGSHQSA